MSKTLMYKIRLYIFIIMGALMVSVFSFTARGAEPCPDDGRPFPPDCYYKLENPLFEGTDKVECVASTVIKFLAQDLMPPIAVLMVLWASFLFLTAGSNPAQVVQARGVLLWTVIGAGVLILAPAFMDLIRQGFGGFTGNIVECASPQTVGATVIGTLINIVNWFSWLIAILSVAVGLYAGFLYMTAAGDPQKLAIAHKVLFYAIVGIAVGIFAFSIIALVEGFVL